MRSPTGGRRTFEATAHRRCPRRPAFRLRRVIINYPIVGKTAAGKTVTHGISDLVFTAGNVIVQNRDAVSRSQRPRRRARLDPPRPLRAPAADRVAGRALRADVALRDPHRSRGAVVNVGFLLLGDEELVEWLPRVREGVRR